jgi:hypothetical protein
MMRRELDYRPMGPAPSTTTVEQMQAKLAARVAAVDKNLACSSTVEPRAVNSVVEGSIPSVPAIQSARDGISVGRAPSAAVEHPVTAATLEWTKGTDAWGIKTKCGRYTILKSVCLPATSVHAAAFNYSAFRTVPGHWTLSLGKVDTPAQARELCEASQREHP